jgi:hypothetical protein
MGRAYGIPVRLHDLRGTQIQAENKLSGVTKQGVLFRVEAVRYAAITPYADPITGDGEWYTTDPKLELFAYGVHKWTEHGATLKDEWSGSRRRWVDLRSPGKQWASHTAEEAVLQFAQRRKRQIWILERQLKRARMELGLTMQEDESLRRAPPSLAIRPY